MDEAAAKRSAAARKAWGTRDREAIEEHTKELVEEARQELEKAKKKYSDARNLANAFSREAKRRAILAVLVLALFLLPAEAQVNMELEEEYPLSRAVAYESVSFMLNRTLRGIPDVPDELMQALRTSSAEVFNLGWKMRASIEDCGVVLPDQRCAEMLRRHLENAGF